MTVYKTILALDSAMNGCGAALYCVDNVSGYVARHSPMMRGQAEALIPLVQNVIKEAGKTFAEIDLVCTTIGPGTFTGLRVGMSAARSFALALNLPLVGISTLDVLAQMYQVQEEPNPDNTLCVLIETKRNDFYTAIYDYKGQALSEPQAMEAKDITAHLHALNASFVNLIGDAVERFLSECNGQGSQKWRGIPGYTQPDTFVLAQAGLKVAIENPETLKAGISPIYLRGADVSVPKTPPRHIAS